MTRFRRLAKAIGSSGRTPSMSRACSSSSRLASSSRASSPRSASPTMIGCPGLTSRIGLLSGRSRWPSCFSTFWNARVGSLPSATTQDGESESRALGRTSLTCSERSFFILPSSGSIFFSLSSSRSSLRSSAVSERLTDLSSRSP